LFLWLDITPRTSIDRFIGKRIVANNIIHINDEGLENYDAHHLVLADRGVSIVEQNNYTLNNLKDVKEWFSKFGIRTPEGDISCWKEVNGGLSIPETIQSCSDEIFAAEQLKQTLKEEQKQK
jgi:hypothetical protein